MLRNKISLQILILLRQPQPVSRQCSAPTFSPVTRPLYSSIFLFLFWIIAVLSLLDPACPPCPGENSPPPFGMTAWFLWLHSANTRNAAFMTILLKKIDRAPLSAIVFFPLYLKPVLKYNSYQLWAVPWNAAINSPIIKRQTRGSVNNGIRVCIFSSCHSHLPALHALSPHPPQTGEQHRLAGGTAADHRTLIWRAYPLLWRLINQSLSYEQSQVSSVINLPGPF